ncbi:MAG: aspartate--tRNA ligase [Actinomycetota bacterium]
MMRTHGAGDLRAEHDGSSVTLAGWVHHVRDHKGVVFVDLRDASGTVQVVFHPQEAPEAAERAHSGIDREFCVLITGTVAKRKQGTENPKLPTGEVEVRAIGLEVLSESLTPPFVIEDDLEADETTRLRYRYLDLRRPIMQRGLRMRHGVTRGIRNFLDERGFAEIQTPTLTRSTPEGARDFLVPSRLQRGSFYALPQSPQLFKQLLMVSGFERYYQIAPCWRDEDLRADRQLEFIQLDLEMSFVEESDVQELMEALMVSLWRDLLGVELEPPFPRLTYDECMRRYGSDKPDLRYDMELTDLQPVFADTTLGIFKKVMESGGSILGIGVRGAGEMTKTDLKRLEQLATERGAKGLAWFRFTREGVDSPLAKFVTEPQAAALRSALGIADGDVALVVADATPVARTVLGALRTHVAAERGIVPEGRWNFLWMTDPPLFEWDDEEQRWISVHHPFTSPQGSIEEMTGDPASVKARAYDLVLNGVELGGGSIRIHRRDVQERVLEELKRDPSEFDFLLEAFAYGPPPHGGIALGIDRIAMLMAGRESIREVIAFPKIQSGVDPLTGAPTPVDPKALRELGIKTIGP